jgi:hypothetical protein
MTFVRVVNKKAYLLKARNVEREKEQSLAKSSEKLSFLGNGSKRKQRHNVSC